MIRNLLIIAGAAFVLSLVTLGGAAAIGGRDMAAHGWSWTFRDGENGDFKVVRADDQRAAEVTRTLAWTGGDTLVIDLPGTVEYVQGDTPGITVRGSADRVDRVRIDGNRLTLAGTDEKGERVVYGRNHNGRGFWINDDQVHIIVTAPKVSTFDILGSADLTLSGYNQDSLTLNISGSGDVSGSGATKTLALTISGSGDVDLSDLLSEDTDVSISGSGDARIAPAGVAKVNLSGSGDVDLATRPTSLSQTITGSGDVTQN